MENRRRKNRPTTAKKTVPVKRLLAKVHHVAQEIEVQVDRYATGWQVGGGQSASTVQDYKRNEIKEAHGKKSVGPAGP
ncbi:hypothetical protein WA026_005784 [Henosepilachna vigintioctopunctata]|uniref:Uncharacterized protein n=1 Tax=Henosepilachna vigintioctopunctata TaxID=420089 RepID=A0AAW1TW26_9CUCU